MNITDIIIQSNVNPMLEPMITEVECLALHDPLLQQLLYLKIVIGVLIVALILFMLVELKRKIKALKE